MEKELKATYLSNIKAGRARKNMTQEDMAKKLGVSTVTYNHKESGKRSFSIDELIIIATVLDTDPETLLKKPT